MSIQQQHLKAVRETVTLALRNGVTSENLREVVDSLLINNPTMVDGANLQTTVTQNGKVIFLNAIIFVMIFLTSVKFLFMIIFKKETSNEKTDHGNVRDKIQGKSFYLALYIIFFTLSLPSNLILQNMTQNLPQIPQAHQIHQKVQYNWTYIFFFQNKSQLLIHLFSFHR